MAKVSSSFNAKFKTIRNKIIMALTAFVILEHNPNNLQRPLALSLSTLSHCISFEEFFNFHKNIPTHRWFTFKAHVGLT